MRAIRSSLVCLATALVVQCAQVEVDEAPGSCSDEAETLKARGPRAEIMEMSHPFLSVMAMALAGYGRYGPGNTWN
jgi:hypothetical protein